jgi:F420-dependent oxidoreductase-like protein
MKLGLMLGYWVGDYADPIDTVLEAESLGFDSVWTAEAYGSDVFSPLCWIGARTTRIKLGTAVMQISARTAACTAMTAASIDRMSGGRLILGIGVSGPQVVEGWYGQPFPKPLARTREYVEIVRKIHRREGPVTNDGPHYPLPHPGGAGLGKPLKLINKPLREHIPIYVGAEGLKNVKLAAEIADGWLPMFIPPGKMDIYRDSLAAAKPDFEIASTVTVVLNDDVAQAMLPVKMSLSFYLGGMGAKAENFHVQLMERLGYGDAARRVQDLFLSGQRAEAVAAVPDELADEIALVGPPERIRERLQAWKESRVTTLLVGSQDPRVMRLLAEELL